VSNFFDLVKTQTIETIPLDEFTKQFDAMQQDFLKLDTQAAEYEILKGGQLTLNKVIGVFL
jgi:FkbM family methyltransferase